MNIAELITLLEELVIDPFDQGEFVFKFMAVFDPPPATLTKMKKAAQKELDPGAELLWPKKLLYRVAEPGQAAPTIDALKAVKIAKNKAPRFLVSTDGEEFSALDTKLDVSLHCDFDQLSKEFSFFLNLAGIETYEALEEAKADVKASVSLSKLYDEIIRTNPDWHTPQLRHALNQFMTRILFCLFAEDTGSFKKDLFVRSVNDLGGADGQQVQSLLRLIFQMMNKPKDQRADFPPHIPAFPYVNGGLFADDLPVPAFSKRAKRLLVEAAKLDWSQINPDIFGSMIQAVVDPALRGDLGMHYTSVPNIMKVLQPLFLMSLEEELEQAIGHRNERSLLKKLLGRISKIRVFDPACGSGNFLIIAYRELRKLEMRIFQRMDELGGGTLTWREQSGVKLSNFYGIEIADFAAETAKLSLWIAEYQMNQQFKNLFGEAPPDFPLKEGGHIHTGNALRLDWQEVCPKPDDEEAETYICGNPPYYGRQKRTPEQREDLEIVFNNFLKKHKNLDYVAAWYLKAAQYMQKIKSEAAFVATNSICQGQHIALLWPLIFNLDAEIGFAHQSFKWKNLATKNAGVTCVIAGLRNGVNGSSRLFEDGVCRKVSHINPYLIEMPDIIVTSSRDPLNKLPPMQFGNMAYCNGNLILSASEKDHLLEHFPETARLIKRLYGSQELIKGIERYCLWISDANLPLARSISLIVERIEKVRKFRLGSSDKGGVKLAERSHQFREMNEAKEHAIIVPSVTSDLRPYVQVGLLGPDDIISNLAFGIYDAPIYLFALISSALHIVWIKAVCGKLKTDYRYSNTLGYNTFPIPPLTDDHKQTLEDHAWNIIAARENHPGKTIAWLYDPQTMPDNLLAAHKALDDTLEKIYIGRPFKNDTERLEHLFKMYAEMTAKKEV